MNTATQRKENKKQATTRTAQTYDNIFIAFDAVTSDLRGEGLNEKTATQCHAINFLSNKLELTWRQVIILTAIMECSFRRNNADIDDIAGWIGCSCMKLMSNSDDFNTLKNRHLITESSRHFGDNVGYSVTDSALNSFKENRNYVHQVPDCATDMELCDCFDELISGCESRNISVGLFHEEISNTIEGNRHLPLASELLSLKMKIDLCEFYTLIVLMTYWVRNNCNEVCISDIQFIFAKRSDFNAVARALSGNKSNLQKLKLVELANNEGFVMRNTFRLTDQCKKQLLPTIIRQNNDVDNVNLKMHDKIIAKTLYYNDGEHEQIQRLTNLLMPEETKRVLQRLKERGLRGGFTCLLYGGPGTGKTETVNQLARSTGRDIFLVDLSQMRSKWYGDSEKIVKHLFDEYRDCVDNSPVAPILLFNEADALFTRRMDKPERSVDKGENTLQNIILQEMETLNGVLIATTNLSQSLDPAFERRFLYKIELSNPAPAVKTKIWQSMFPTLSEEDARKLASTYDLSGGQIENIVRKCTIDEVLTGSNITIEQMHDYCRNEKLKSNHKSVGFKQ